MTKKDNIRQHTEIMAGKWAVWASFPFSCYINAD